MAKKILFFGTSHVGALKIGFDRFAKSNHVSDISCYFVGISGPEMVASIYKGWKLDGSSIVPPDIGMSYFTAVGGVSPSEAELSQNRWGVELSRTLTLNLDDLDEIVFVDMFYRYPENGRFKMLNDNLTCSNIPISLAFFNQLKLVGVGGCHLLAHKVYGDIPYQSSLEFLKMVVSGAATVKKVSLIPAPRPMKRNCNYGKLFKSESCVKDTLDFYDRYYANQLREEKIDFVSQVPELLCRDTGLTPDEYSRGKHPTRADLLDHHGNADFGEIVIRSYFKQQSES